MPMLFLYYCLYLPILYLAFQLVKGNCVIRPHLCFRVHALMFMLSHELMKCSDILIKTKHLRLCIRCALVLSSCYHVKLNQVKDLCVFVHITVFALLSNYYCPGRLVVQTKSVPVCEIYYCRILLYRICDCLCMR